jgi:hypothetical protein
MNASHDVENERSEREGEGEGEREGGIWKVRKVKNERLRLT